LRAPTESKFELLFGFGGRGILNQNCNPLPLSSRFHFSICLSSPDGEEGRMTICFVLSTGIILICELEHLETRHPCRSASLISSLRSFLTLITYLLPRKFAISFLLLVRMLPRCVPQHCVTQFGGESRSLNLLSHESPSKFQ
jgi:hypothetical protein